MKRIADKGKHTFFVRQKTAKPSSSLVPKSLPIYFYQQGNFFIFNKLYFENYLTVQTSVSETSEWLDILSGYKFFCSFIVVKKRSNSSVCKTRNKHRVATRIVFLRALCFKPKSVVKAKHILFYYRADCLSG